MLVPVSNSAWHVWGPKGVSMVTLRINRWNMRGWFVCRRFSGPGSPEVGSDRHLFVMLRGFAYYLRDNFGSLTLLSTNGKCDFFFFFFEMFLVESSSIWLTSLFGE